LAKSSLEKNRNFTKAIILISAPIVGLLIGVELFGVNSYFVMEKAKKRRDALLTEIKKLQSQNRLLQKRYFELLQISGGDNF